MAASFTIDTTASGRQITGVTTDAGTLSLLASQMLALRLWDTDAGEMVTTPVEVSGWSPAVTGSGADQTITWTDAVSGSTAAARIRALTGPDRVTVQVSATIAGSLATDRALHGIICRARFAPWEADLLSTVFPDRDSTAYADATASGLNWRAFYPFCPVDVLGDDALSETSMASGETGVRYMMTQALPFFTDPGTRSLYFSSDDIAGRGKTFGISGDGSSVTVELVSHAANGRLATTWAPSYSWEFVLHSKPEGDAFGWHDSMMIHRARMAGLGLRGYTRDDWRDRADVPTRVKSLTMFSSVNRLQTETQSTVVEEWAEDIEAAIPGASQRMLYQDYTWGTEGLAEAAIRPEQPAYGAQTLRTSDALRDLGAEVTYYTLHRSMDNQSPNWASKWLAANARDAAGDPVIPVVTLPLGQVVRRAPMRWTDTQPHLDALDSYRDRLLAADDDSWGIFHDTLGFAGEPDYDPALAADNRGLGAPIGTHANTVLLAIEEDYADNWSGRWTTSEGCTDHSVGSHSIQSVTWGAQAGAETSHLPWFAPLWAGLARLNTYSTALLAERNFAFAFVGYSALPVFSRAWHAGQMVGFAGAFEGQPSRTTGRFFTGSFPNPNPEWDRAYGTLFTLTRRMFVGLSSAIQRFHTGRRLRPLPGSWERTALRVGDQLESYMDPFSGINAFRPDGTQQQIVETSVWTDPDTGALGIFGSNWHWQFSGTMRVRMTTAAYPELPAGEWLRVVVTDPDTGAERTDAHFRRADGLDCALSLSPGQVTHWRIEAADSAQVNSPESPASWTPNRSDTLAWSSTGGVTI